MDEKRFNKLLKKIKTDPLAFTEIYEYYFPKIVIHTAIRFQNMSLGEDAAQDFFRKILTMDLPERVDKPTSWIYRISDNATINLLLRRQREVLTYSEIAQEFPNNEVEQIIYEEYCTKLETITEPTKTIIKMNVWEGYSLKEISIILDIDYAVVRKKYSRGIKKLKKL